MSLKPTSRCYLIFLILLFGKYAFATDSKSGGTCEDLSGFWKLVSEYKRSCTQFDGHVVNEIPVMQEGCRLVLGEGKLKTSAILKENTLIFPESVYPTVWDKGVATYRPLEIKVTPREFSGIREWNWVGDDKSSSCDGTEFFKAVRISPEVLTSGNKQLWPLSSPEDESFNVEKFREALKWADTSLELSSVLVLRNGKTVHEQYFQHFDHTSLHNIFSVAKSFMSTAVGISIDQKTIKSIEAPLSSFFPGYFSGSEKRPAITLRDLLVMSAGIEWNEHGIGKAGSIPDWAGAEDQVSKFFSLPIDSAFKPGQWFTYSSANTHILSVVLGKSANIPSIEFIQKQLFEPLGIRNYSFDTTPAGDYVGGYTLSLSTRDMAKLGILYLNQGKWFGKRIVSEAWTEAATTKQIDNQWSGYGYHWWITNYAGVPGYSAMGYGGQQVLVVPEKALVVAVTNTDKSLENNIHELLNRIVRSAQ